MHNDGALKVDLPSAEAEESHSAAAMRSGDASSTAAFCLAWSGPVFAYCSEVCGPDLAGQATAIACADVVEKLRWLPVWASEVPAAVLGSARMAAIASLQGTTPDGRRLDAAERAFATLPAPAAPADVRAAACDAALQAVTGAEPEGEREQATGATPSLARPGSPAAPKQWLLPQTGSHRPKE